MNLTHVWRRGLSGVRFAIAFATAAAFAATTLPATAGTTGVLNGTVTDASSGAPIASASVTASAPTGTFRTTTNARGVYVFPGIYPDTYTVSVTATGHQPQTQPGVTVFADQTATIDFKLGTELRTIAKVTAHSVGGAFQPSQTTDTYTVTSQQAQDLIGNNLNISETTLITSLPGASLDSSGYPVIRGGRENEESFQFEGIPYTDAFTNQFTNALALPGAGLQSAQLTPGLGSADQSSLGTGSLNLVVKRGSAPGYANFTMSAGGPGFDHRLNFEYGWATPGGHDSLYAAFAGQNSNPNFGHGASALSIGEYYGTREESDREGLFNFVHRFGKDNNQSIQLFGDFAEHDFFIGYGGVTQCYKTCDPFYTGTARFYANLLPQLYGGPNPGLTSADVRALTPLNPYQASPTQTLAASGQTPYTYYEPNQAYKIEYTNNLNESTYLSAMYYHVNSVTTFDFPYASANAFYPDFLALQGGFQDGIKANLTKELSEKNLLKIGFNYALLRPVYDQQEYTYGFLQTIPGLFGNSGNAEYADFVPGGIVSNAVNGGTSTVRMPYSYEPSATTRQLFGFGINDTITPNDKWKFDLGLRVDGANDHMDQSVGIDPNTCFFYYQPVDQGTPAGGVRTPGNCGNPTFNVGKEQLQPRVLEPTIAVNYRIGRNDSLRASYGRSTEFLPLGGIDHWGGLAYYEGFPYSNLNPALSYSGVNFYGGGAVTNCGLLHDTVCPNYGSMLYWDNQSALGTPFQPVKPETFINMDLSWSHQFTKGVLRGTEFKLTPWYRKGYDVFAATQSPVIVNGKPLTSPSGAVVFNPPVQSNQGYSRAVGTELNVTHLVPTGLSWQFNATYQNEFSSVIPLSGSEDFFPTLPPASLALGNIYRVGYLSPFQFTFALSDKLKNGLRINPIYRYDVGYPYNAGTVAAAFVNGVAYNLPNTNVLQGIVSGSAQGSTSSYVDPINPGSLFNPNIAATRGTPESASPGGKLSHPEAFIDLNLEYAQANSRVTYGLQINNLFDEVYGGAGLAPYYQPVATGIGGPLTGVYNSGLGYTQGSYGYANRGSNRYGTYPYNNTPNGVGRSYYFYVTFKV